MDEKKIIQKCLHNLVDFQITFKICWKTIVNKVAQKLKEMTEIYRDKIELE